MSNRAAAAAASSAATAGTEAVAPQAVAAEANADAAEANADADADAAEANADADAAEANADADADADAAEANADADAAEAEAVGTGPALDRAGLAVRADVPAFVVDLVIDAGLLTPAEHGPDGERFGPDAVDMLVAARTLVGEGVTVEELAALAMRHATNVEELIDDAIDLFKRHADHGGGDRAALAASVQRLVPVATQLVAGHFEKTLSARAMARIGDEPGSAAGAIVVRTERLAERVDPLAVYAAAADQTDRNRSVWLRPDAGLGLAALGVVDTIEPVGEDRFSGASAARAVLEARIRRQGPDDGPAPVLVGGFSFAPSHRNDDDSGSAAVPDDDSVSGGAAASAADVFAEGDEAGSRGPAWDGFGDCRLVLPELTVIDRVDGTWVQVATRVGSDGDEAAAGAELAKRLEIFESEPRSLAPAPTAIAESAAGYRPDGSACDRDDDYLTLVASAVEAIGRGELHKVVLARTVTLDAQVDGAVVLNRLRRRNPSCAVFAFTVADSTFLGATPEELVTLDGPRLHTTALAGTAPRGDSPADDESLAAGLLASAKNRSEHRFVVDGITAALTGLGLVDPAPAEPGLMQLSRLQHLHTPITARVQRRRSGVSDMDVLRVAGVLHPTAAVGGAPTAASLDFIASHEGFDRGWYAAPVGWCDLDGNGELAVALRSALAEPGRTHLFAGAGIVADSVPAEELEETTFKLRALLDVIDRADGP